MHTPWALRAQLLEGRSRGWQRDPGSRGLPRDVRSPGRLRTGFSPSLGTHRSCRRGGRVRIPSIWPAREPGNVIKGDIDFEGPVDPPPHRLWPDPEEPRLGPVLVPGRWVVVIGGEGLLTQRIPVRVHPGRVTDVKVRVVLDPDSP